jgi:hypothetical protein
VSDEYVKVPRLSVEVSDETAIRFANAVPWGLRSKVLAIMVDDLLELIESEGEIVITALVNRVIRAEHIIKGISRKGE